MGEALREPQPVSFLKADQRHDPRVRRKLSAPAVRTFLNIAAKWGLSVEEQRALLGWPAESTFHKYKSGQVSALSYDTLMRVSLIIGIYTALNILFPEPDLAHRWVKLPNNNPLFGGRTALAHMMEGGMDALYQVRRLLDSRRGGWN
jgi:hypothetical protein